MIEKFEKESNHLSSHTIGMNDVIIATADMERVDVDECQQVFKNLQKVFPTNDIVFNLKGIDLDIIRRK